MNQDTIYSISITTQETLGVLRENMDSEAFDVMLYRINLARDCQMHRVRRMCL